MTRSIERRFRPRVRVALALTGALLLGATGLSASALGMSAVGAAATKASSGPATLTFSTSSASMVLDTIGINIHDNWLDTTYAPGGDTTALVSSLRASGVRWVRIGLKKHPFAYQGPFLDTLRASGIKVSGVIGSPSSPWDDFQTGESGLLLDSLKNGPYAGRIDMLELPNESNTSNASYWVPRLRQFDTEYYTALRKDAVTRPLPIVGPSVSVLSDCKLLGGLAATQDYFNTHPYSGTGIPEAPTANACRDLGRQGGLPVGQPMMATEFGWTNDLNDRWQGVTESTASLYLVRSYLWNASHGITRSFAYELFDKRPDAKFTDPQMHFGLVGVTGDVKKPATWKQTPKPAFRSLQRLTTALERGGETGTGPTLRLNAATATTSSGVNVQQITHRDGSTSVAVWLADPASSKRTVDVSLSVPGAKTAEVLDVPSGAKSTTAPNASVVTVSASASLKIVRFSAK